MSVSALLGSIAAGFLIPAANAAPVANWNISGAWALSFVYNGVPNPSAYDVTLAQNGNSLAGSGGYPSGGPYQYQWVIDSGTVSGNNFNFTAHYTAGADALTPLTTMQVSGTVAPDGSISGVWSDNYQGGSRSGTWTGTSTCTAIAGQTLDTLPVTAAVVAANGQKINGKLAVSKCGVGVYVGPSVTGVSVGATINNDTLAGVDVNGGGADVTGATISNIGDTPLDGNQYGWGVLYANGATGKVANSKISSYQKAGVKITDAGTNVTVSGNTVTGQGQITYIAQNGVEYVDGATGGVTNNQISGNSYVGPTACADENYFAPSCYQSGGVLLYDAASGITIANNKVSNNDIGIWPYEDTVANKTYTVSNNWLQNNYGYGVVFDGANGTSTLNSFQNNQVGLLVTDESQNSVVTSLNDQFAGNDVNNEAIQATPGSALYENLVVETTGRFVHLPVFGGPHSPRFPRW